MTNENKIIAYKGFDKDFKCRDFQYAVGKTYEMDGDVKCCSRGFHACESPMEVFDHYDMLSSRFAEVEQSGKMDKEADSTKTCSSRIKIKAELKLADIINLGVEWLKEFTMPSKIETNNSCNKDYSAKIGSSGDYAQIGSSGNSAKIGSSGNSAKIGSSGDYAQIGSSGYSAQIGSSGNSAKIGSSGNYAQIGSSGYYAQIGSSGYSAKIGSSGDSAKIGSSGDYAKIGSSGYSAQIGSSGDYAKIGSSGNYAQIGSSGKDSVIMCAGYNSKAKAAIGSWITLAEWKRIEDVWKPICVKTEQVDGKRIKADTYYKLIDGKFDEVE